MKTLGLFAALTIPSILFSQWRPLEIPHVGISRYDDVFFIDETKGWAVNSIGSIYKTINGGETWSLKFQADNYLRSIEFASDMIGYAGSLNSSIYRTTDGGETWENISENVDFDITYKGQNFTEIPGACGLSAPSDDVIYACGLWSGDPPFLSKSTDGGETWTTFDMSQHATQLVDVFFLDNNEGFLAGRNDPEGNERGGIILHTTNGGETWSNVLETLVEGDYIWKIQTPDSVNFFGSIQSLPASGNVRFAKSSDTGQSWSLNTVTDSKWNYIQMIGFKDPMNGWTGGTASAANGSETVLFETADGGETWEEIQTYGNTTFNRFFMVNSEHIFLTGKRVYVYDENYPGDDFVLESTAPFHTLRTYPNPASTSTQVDLSIVRFTRIKLELFNSSGELVRVIQEGTIGAGNHSFFVSLDNLPGGQYFVCLHTNEGLNYSKMVKE